MTRTQTTGRDRVLPAEADGPGDGGTRLAGMIRASLGVARAWPDEFLTLSNSWTYIRRTPEPADDSRPPDKLQGPPTDLPRRPGGRHGRQHR